MSPVSYNCVSFSEHKIFEMISCIFFASSQLTHFFFKYFNLVLFLLLFFFDSFYFFVKVPFLFPFTAKVQYIWSTYCSAIAGVGSIDKASSTKSLFDKVIHAIWTLKPDGNVLLSTELLVRLNCHAITCNIDGSWSHSSQEVIEWLMTGTKRELNCHLHNHIFQQLS